MVELSTALDPITTTTLWVVLIFYKLYAVTDLVMLAVYLYSLPYTY